MKGWRSLQEGEWATTDGGKFTDTGVKADEVQSSSALGGVLESDRGLTDLGNIEFGYMHTTPRMLLAVSVSASPYRQENRDWPLGKCINQQLSSNIQGTMQTLFIMALTSGSWMTEN